MDEELEAQRQVLWPDVELVEAYVEQRSDTYGGAWWGGADITFAFTNPDEHRPTLHGLVAHPDRIHIVGVARPLAKLDALADRVSDDFSEGMWGKYEALGIGANEAENIVDICLHPLEDDLAERLRSHYVHVDVYHWVDGGRPPDE